MFTDFEWNTDQELMFALVDGIHQMTDKVAATNAISVLEQGQWAIDVSVDKLLSTGDYARCLAYLQGLKLVTGVDILGAEPGLVHFRMQLNASPEFLLDAFSRGSVLLPVDSGEENHYEYLH